MSNADTKKRSVCRSADRDDDKSWRGLELVFELELGPHDARTLYGYMRVCRRASLAADGDIGCFCACSFSGLFLGGYFVFVFLFLSILYKPLDRPALNLPLLSVLVVGIWSRASCMQQPVLAAAGHQKTPRLLAGAVGVST
jgi:hypothetical protein